MKKRLNTEAILSELKGNSAFFPNYKKQETTSPEKLEESPIQGVPGVPPPVPRTVPRTGQLIPKVKRPIRQRQPFDIYEDQYVALKKIADAERGFVNGRGMSRMVREAIDNYLSGQKPSQETSRK
jgi:hypothetical protein